MIRDLPVDSGCGRVIGARQQMLAVVGVVAGNGPDRRPRRLEDRPWAGGGVPDQPPVDGILRRYLAAHAPHLAWLADLLDTANRAIGDPDQHIGPSHFMGDVDETWARRAWSYSVMPTLRELYYHDTARADTFEFDALRDTLPSPDPASQDPADHEPASDPAD